MPGDKNEVGKVAKLIYNQVGKNAGVVIPVYNTGTDPSIMENLILWWKYPGSQSGLYHKDSVEKIFI